MIKKIDLLGFGSSLISLLNCLCKYYVHSYQIFYLYFKIFLKQLLSVIDLIFFYFVIFVPVFNVCILVGFFVKLASFLIKFKYNYC